MLYRTLKPLVPSRITSLKHCLSAWVSWHYGRLCNKSTERKFYIRVKPAKHLMQASVAWRPQSPFRLLGMGRGAQGGRVDIHTAPKFWSNAQNLIMYVTRKLCPVSSFFCLFLVTLNWWAERFIIKQHNQAVQKCDSDDAMADSLRSVKNSLHFSTS